MKRFYVIFVCVTVCCSCIAQQPVEMDLWPDGAPESNGLTKTERGDDYSFAKLFYPVITMKEEFTHLGSRRNLIGDGYNAELVNFYSNEDQVTSQTPPTFLITSDNDEVVVSRNSIEFYSALKRNNIPAVLYVIPDGGHGWGTQIPIS